MEIFFWKLGIWGLIIIFINIFSMLRIYVYINFVIKL